MRSSPTARGWRTIWRDPTLVLGEIAWRWTFGLIVLLIVTAGFMAYLSTIEVPAPALWLISTREPTAIAAAFFYMFRDSGWAATKISLVALPPLGVLWIVVASVGRAATLPPLFGAAESGQQRRPGWRGLLGLNFLRFLLWLTANIACAGWLVIAFATMDDPALSLLIFISGTTVVLAIWAGLNWLLSLALIFAVREQADTFRSISLAVDVLSRRFSELLATSSAWAVARGIAFIAAIFLLGGVLSFSGRMQPGFLLIGAIAVTLAYLALSDMVYMCRLTSYVAIIEAKDEPPAEASVAVPAYPVDPGWSQLPPEQPA